MNGNKTVTAIFSRAPTPTPTPTPTPEHCVIAPWVYTGSGTVSGPASVRCGSVITVTASPASGWCFAYWYPQRLPVIGGGVTGSAPTCHPDTEETDVTAAFHARLGAVFYREGTMPPVVIPSGREDGAETTPTATGTPAP